MKTTEDLIRVIQDEVAIGKATAEDLRRARADNVRYLEAIHDRDGLIREYVETIQDLRSVIAGKQDHS